MIRPGAKLKFIFIWSVFIKDLLRYLTTTMNSRRIFKVQQSMNGSSTEASLTYKYNCRVRGGYSLNQQCFGSGSVLLSASVGK